MDDCSFKITNRTRNGKILVCKGCNKVYIEFNNFFFSFEHEEFITFKKFFRKLDGQHWEKTNQHTVYNRKIMVPLGHKNIRLMLNLKELEELKRLLAIVARKTNNLAVVGNRSIVTEWCSN